MQLTENQLTTVEAVYLVCVDDNCSYDFKFALSKHIYETNIYMYIYLEWLLSRWFHIYARHKFDLPYRAKKKSMYIIMDDSVRIKIPVSVKRQAKYAYKLKELGFLGGTATGWKRAKQLSEDPSISIEDLRDMKSWFARHVYASYPSYKAWIDAGKPLDEGKWHRTNGIIAWLIWGSTAAFNWVNSDANIRLLNKHYPNKNYTKTEL